MRSIAVGTREKNLRYAAELGGALVIYAITLPVSMHFVSSLPAGPPRDGVAAVPMLGVLLAIWAIARHFQRVDEYIRKVTLEHLSIAAAVTAGWTLTYGFLENAGFPRLSMFVVWPVMGAVWGVLGLAQCTRSR